MNFEGTRSPARCVLRLVGGFAVYFALNTLLKLPFSDELLESAMAAAFAIRFFRYCIVIFCALGVYPMLFGRIKKV